MTDDKLSIIMSGIQRLSALILLLVVASFARAAGESQGISGKLLDADGHALAGATICLCARNVDVYDAHLPFTDWNAEKIAAWRPGESATWLASTNSEGEFSFAAPASAYTLFAANEIGYLIARSKNLALPATLRLTRWAKIHCIVMRGAVPAGAGLPISVGYSYASWPPDEVGPYLHFRGSQTDPHGEFTIERAFAGNYSIARTGGASTSAKAVAGEVCEVVLRISGRPVVGKIAIPQGLRGRTDWNLMPSGFGRDAQLPSLVLPADFLHQSPQQREEWIDQWKRSDQGKRALRDDEIAMQDRVIDFNAHKNHSFRVDDLEPGDYTVPAFFYGYKGDKLDMSHHLLSVAYRFTVPPIPGGASDEPLDVGTLEPQPRGLMSLGQLAPDFAFQTVDGAEHTVGEFEGKTILLDFWGTWCPGCVQDITQIKEIHDTFGRDENFVMISLSARDSLEKLRPFIATHEMTWTQASIGNDKDALPLLLYQVSGFPSYWLIARDGKTLYHDWSCDDLKDAVAKALGPAHQ